MKIHSVSVNLGTEHNLNKKQTQLQKKSKWVEKSSNLNLYCLQHIEQKLLVLRFDCFEVNDIHSFCNIFVLFDFDSIQVHAYFSNDFVEHTSHNYISAKMSGLWHNKSETWLNYSVLKMTNSQPGFIASRCKNEII